LLELRCGSLPRRFFWWKFKIEDSKDIRKLIESMLSVPPNSNNPSSDLGDSPFLDAPNPNNPTPSKKQSNTYAPVPTPLTQQERSSNLIKITGEQTVIMVWKNLQVYLSLFPPLHTLTSFILVAKTFRW
jgi:hypothetical protein